MGVEIERKFLVKSDDWQRHVVKRSRVRQAYLSRAGQASVRVRMVDDAVGTLTIKSRGAQLARAEFEYPIPVAEAEGLLALRDGYLIAKVRHIVRHAGMTWEIDVFEGVHEGLVIAEVELLDESQSISLPPWVGREVTRDEPGLVGKWHRDDTPVLAYLAALRKAFDRGLCRSGREARSGIKPQR